MADSINEIGQLDILAYNRGMAGRQIAGQNIARLIRERNISQRQLATISGVKQSSISKAIKGVDTSIDTIEALARALGVHLWEMFLEDPAELLSEKERFVVDSMRQDAMAHNTVVGVCENITGRSVEDYRKSGTTDHIF